MKKIIIKTLLITLICILTGCVTTQEKKQLADIEAAYKAGELTPAQYYALKLQMEQNQSERNRAAANAWAQGLQGASNDYNAQQQQQKSNYQQWNQQQQQQQQLDQLNRIEHQQRQNEMQRQNQKYY